jgi:hypothetical protein
MPFHKSWNRVSFQAAPANSTPLISIFKSPNFRSASLLHIRDRVYRCRAIDTVS